MTDQQFELSIELFTLCMGGGSNPGYIGQWVAPSATDIERIQEALGIVVPADFVHLARSCPVYEQWFASIGPNFDRHFHILSLRRLHHDPSSLWVTNGGALLPPSLILINHAHDGDADCWLVDPTSTTEPPIYYIDIEEPQASEMRLIQPTFRRHLLFHALHWSKAQWLASDRRAKELREQLQGIL